MEPVLNPLPVIVLMDGQGVSVTSLCVNQVVTNFMAAASKWEHIV